MLTFSFFPKLTHFISTFYFAHLNHNSHTNQTFLYIKMNFDEREEDFREMAAMGNIKAVTAYLRSGIQVDHQNKVNGWTALHWACARGHLKVADMLIRAGANLHIKNTKSQRPVDICKTDELRELFGFHMGSPEMEESCRASSGIMSEQSFVPNYMNNPDFSKAWGVPDSAMLPGHGESGYMRQRQFEASMSNSSNRLPNGTGTGTGPIATTSAIGEADGEERELLVYGEQYNDENLIGSVFVDNPAQTVTELISQIREELDGVPEKISISRYNGKLTIPISAKQEEFSINKFSETLMTW
ncbi:hypothetical protein BX661DRAFT_183863 [Kickxella alabastrina]|uniref:uncharacterized protein n=1 Tax=Kickxella alabastrina TaxID=61397 RepID=UPI002220BE55|nr:uncharacterized protein BX661DRAFT_183863 [Kickxella alabastrina]KAI7826365.1 hypothetical protein BX661DRAFT_183863 [Kickxella alabastrina]